MKMNLYYYFYCRIYNFYKLLSFGTNDILEYSAMFALSILVFLNVVTLSAIIELNGFLIILDSKIEFIGIGLLICMVNYYIFIRKNKHHDIIREYSRRNRFDSSYSLLFYLYLLFTLWSAFSITEEVRELHLNQMR